MIEVLWHGRGGQGAFTAARLLGAAASFEEGAFAMAFPSFGPERRGAPMRAFTKFDKAPIGNRSAISKADYVVYLDDTLLKDGWEEELKEEGIVLVNSSRSFLDRRIIALDANGISEAVLGRPIPNTVFLGAISAICAELTPEAAKRAIAEYMPEKLHEKNWCIVDQAVRAISSVKSASCESDLVEDAPLEPSDAKDAKPQVEASSTLAESSRIRCRLRNETDSDAPSLDSSVFAKNTCYSAGHLVAKNAGWRNVRPVFADGICTLCLQCYLYCPDGTIYKVRDENGETMALAIDYDFCKGCGICARVCKFHAIEMVNETGDHGSVGV